MTPRGVSFVSACPYLFNNSLLLPSSNSSQAVTILQRDSDKLCDNFEKTNSCLTPKVFPVRVGLLSIESQTRMAWREFDRYLDTLPNVSPRLYGNDLDLLIDGPQIFPEMKGAIEAANVSIKFQTYEFFGDAALKMANLLIDKANKKVKVRAVINEAALKDPKGKQAVELLQKRAKETKEQGYNDHQLEVVIDYEPPLSEQVKIYFSGNSEKPLVSHRKSLIVDAATNHALAFIGGMNVTDEEVQGKWHDVHVKMSGPAVQYQRRNFFKLWFALNPNISIEHDVFQNILALEANNEIVRVIGHTPGQEENIRKMYLKAIQSSRRSIYIENPYVDDPLILKALIVAAQRNPSVKVKLLFPANNDVPDARDAYRSWYPSLIAAGCEIYEYLERMSHGKMAAFDGGVATIGSANLDWFSRMNYEENLLIQDREGFIGFVEKIERQIRWDIEKFSVRISKVVTAAPVSQVKSYEDLFEHAADPDSSFLKRRFYAIDEKGRIVNDGVLPNLYTIKEYNGPPEPLF